MAKATNKYSYAVDGGSVSGAFNVYQGKSGKIYLLMGNNVIDLTHEQVIKLGIDVFSLMYFDYDAYELAYKGGLTQCK